MTNIATLSPRSADPVVALAASWRSLDRKGASMNMSCGAYESLIADKTAIEAQMVATLAPTPAGAVEQLKLVVWFLAGSGAAERFAKPQIVKIAAALAKGTPETSYLRTLRDTHRLLTLINGSEGSFEEQNWGDEIRQNALDALGNAIGTLSAASNAIAA